ncbi:MAG: glycoside hydrolase family 28 protein, partial [Theionarchaea archaeon]|nr:glycoside hydrolase family 28 protein [Theionarchaea archaeon]
MTDERANAMDLGAEGNGLSNDTTAVQSAIDGCYDAGGGTVYFPPGRYLSGSIVLKSRVSLNLEGGAVLLASRDPSDYADRRILISAEGAENVTICGRGTIDGQADEDLGRRPGHEGEERPKFRTSLVRFDDCTDVSVRDVTMKSSDAWTLHFRGCCNVLVDGITILNNYFRTNTDGINPVSCRNVHISNCYLVCGDDCVCIKS